MRKSYPSTIVPTPVPEYYTHNHQGKRLPHCVKESIKNSRDATATRILIDTSDKKRFIIADNGWGLDATGFRALLDPGRTSHKFAFQHSKYGTGFLHWLFSFCSKVVVKTITKQEPKRVRRMRVLREEYVKMLIGRVREGFPIEDLPRTHKTWPFEEFATGAIFEFIFEDPGSRKIKRGAKLAQALSTQLPWHFEDIVLVDGQPLPPKEIVGKRFQLEINDPYLGNMIFDLYHPEPKKARQSDGGTLVGTGEVGEVPFPEFLRNLDRKQVEQVPAVYRLAACSGTISGNIFQVNEDRHSAVAEIADDPRITPLIKLLQRLAPAVCQNLQIKEQSQGGEGVSTTLSDIRQVFNQVYPGSTKKPRVDQPSPPPPEKEERLKKALTIKAHRREYEVGERIEIKAAIKDLYREGFELPDINWFVGRSLGEDLQKNDRGISLRASRVGSGIVSAELLHDKQGRLSDSTMYRVVQVRQLKLAPTQLSIRKGETIVIAAQNSDKIQGQLSWHLSGVGEYSVREADKLAIFYNAVEVGEAFLEASDNGGQKACCEIMVIPQRKEQAATSINIGEHTFLLEEATTYNALEPIEMLVGSTRDKVHSLVQHTGAPGVAEADQRDALDIFWIHAVAEAYPFFIQRAEGQPIDRDDLDDFVTKARQKAYKIFQEIMSAYQK